MFIYNNIILESKYCLDDDACEKCYFVENKISCHRTLIYDTEKKEEFSAWLACPGTNIFKLNIKETRKIKLDKLDADL